MKKLVVILFSLWVVWTQSPLGLRSEAAAAEKAACPCCCGCGGACGCMSPAGQDHQPLPAATPSPSSLQTELSLLAAPAGTPALPGSELCPELLSSADSAAGPALPIFRRDCALRL